VSWGAILAGTLGTIAVGLILWAFAAAITFTATHASVGSLTGTTIALWICGIITTLIGAFVGGWFAGYLPGNRNRLMGATHGFLAWALAFVLVSAGGFGVLAGLAKTTTDVAATTAAATAQTAGATVGGIAGGQLTLDRKAENLLESLGYPPSEARTMVDQGKDAIQRELHGGGRRPTMASPIAAFDSAINWVAGLTWSWFGTWLVSGLLAILGGILAARQLRPRVIVHSRPVVTEVPLTPAPAT
jgi:hypothetical protein